MNKKAIFASKKLNKLCSHIDNTLFSADVFWCRTAYDGFERWNYNSHRHSFYEFVVVLEGYTEYEMVESANRIKLNKNKLVLIAPGTVHRIVSVSKGSSIFKFAFQIKDPVSLVESLNAVIDECYTDIADVHMLNLIEFMHVLAAEEKSGSVAAVKELTSALAIRVLQGVNTTFEDDIRNVQANDKDDRVRITKQIIKDNLADKIKTEDIASQLNISMRQLNRIIKFSENLTVSELIRKIRIKEVKHLLSATRLSLDTIAEMTGFLNGAHLSRVFKSEEGTTPGQYRKDILNIYRKDF